MLPSKINIDHLTIKMTHGRRFVPTSNYLQNEIQTGEITTGEYNIDEITSEVNEDKIFYYPKRILSYMIPFLVKLIEQSILVKCIYSFGLYQHDPFQNPHDIQGVIKDIEVVLEFEYPQGAAERLIKGCLENMDDSRRMIDQDIDDGVALFVSRIEIFDKKDNNLVPVFDTYKEDNCMICMEDKPNIIFCNCGHIVVCEKCLLRLVNKKCPKCRCYNTIIRRIK